MIILLLLFVNVISYVYSDVRLSMKYDRGNLIIELVMSSLRYKELELKQVVKKFEEKVMLVRGRNHGRQHDSGNKWSKNSRRCYNCEEVDHYIKYCPKPFRMNKSEHSLKKKKTRVSKLML